MTDQSSLIAELTIDRDARQDSGSSRVAVVLVSTAFLLLLVMFGWYMTPPSGREPERATLTPEEPEPAEVPVTRSAALDASGYVVARRQATVSAQITGQLTEVLIEEGQRVEAGQVIARLDESTASAALAQAEARLAQSQAAANAARIAFENEQSLHARHLKLYAASAISRHEYEIAKATHDAAEAELSVRVQAVAVAEADVALALKNKEFTVIRAPFAGIVTVKAAQAGEIISPTSAGGGFTRTGVGTIVDMDSLEVEVDVSENFIQRVHPGQSALVTLNAYPDRTMAAEVIAVVSTADRARATVKVRVGFMDKDSRVLPEMGARVSFIPEAASQGSRVRPSPVASMANTIPQAPRMRASAKRDGRHRP